MLWHIKGADSKSGKDVNIQVDALNENEALFFANNMDVLVEHIQPQMKVPLTTNAKAAMIKYLIATITSLLFLGLVLIAWDRSHQPIVFDPATNFKKFCDSFVPQLCTSFKNRGVFIDDDAEIFNWDPHYYINISNNDYSIDVKKTDSLISPYIGILVVRIFEVYKSGSIRKPYEDCILHLTINFAYQDDSWILKDATIHVHNNITDYDIDLFKDSNQKSYGSYKDCIEQAKSNIEAR